MSIGVAFFIILAAIIIGAVGALFARVIVFLVHLLLEVVAIAGLVVIGWYVWWRTRE